MGMADDNAPSDLREVFRYQRGEEVRVYSLRVAPGCTELWRTTQQPGCAAVFVKETDLRGRDQTVAFLAEVKDTLVAGRWRQC
jgi:hypothetical protein